MILDSGREIACEITDFCLGGLFLKLPPLAVDAGLSEVNEGSLIRVAFATSSESGGQAHEFSARLVRHGESGIGVAFDEPPVAAMLTLNKVAAVSRSRRSATNNYRGGNAGELKRACRELLRQVVSEGFANFSKLLAPRIEQALVSTKSVVERSELQAALKLIPPSLGDIERRSGELLLGRLLSSRNGIASHDGLGSELALVEKEDFEDWISVTTISNMLAEHFVAELDILDMRLEMLFGSMLDAWNNPVVPDTICKDFRQSFAELKLAKPARLTIDAIWYDALVEPLGEFYRKLLYILPKVEGEDQRAAEDKSSSASKSQEPATLGSVASALVGHAQTGGSGQETMLSASSLKLLKDLIARGVIPTARQDEARVSANVFASLLNAIGSEKSVPAEVRPHFMQLEDALLRLALLDPSYLNNPGHPAHAALNVMDRLSLISSDDGRIEDERVLEQIGKWVERIRNEVESNPAVFEQVQQQVENFLRPLMKERNTRIAQLQASLEGWQKTGQANRRVLLQIEQRVAGKSVPVIVLELFTSGWRNFLIRVLLRHGENSAEEKAAWEVVDRLLAWLDAESPIKPSYQEVQQLLQEVDSRLKLVCADRDMQDRLVERLTKVLLKQEEAILQIVPSILPAQFADDSSQKTGQDEDDPLEAFRVGDWINFDGMSVPLNLIWIGDDPVSYVFCNYKGIKKLELGRGEFIQRLVSGKARLAESLELPLIERSFGSMIQRIHQNLLEQAAVDEETGLADRREFMRRAAARLLDKASARTQGEDSGQVMGVLDVESLRLLRSRLDEEGYAGLTQALASHLERSLASSLLARSSEYTFAFMLPVGDPDQIQSAAEKIISDINSFSFKWDELAFSLSANLGLVYSSMNRNPEELYRHADEACLEAKHLGRNQIVVRKIEDGGQGGHSWLDGWSTKITEWLQSERLFLRCQPIVNIRDGSAVTAHYEILLGVDEAGGMPVNIGEMMAVVEQLHRASEVDQWVIRAIFDWMRKHPGKLEEVSGLSINLSAQSINSRSFLDFLSSEMDQGNIAGDKLIFEITESAAIDSFFHAERFIRQMRRYGCRFALDDFGVGFSSFAYLKNLKVDYLKIDGSFIRNMSHNEVDVALVKSMHETSRFLGIKTIAEVVENQETLDLLREIGVDYVQGYFTGMPMPIAQIVDSAAAPEPACQA